MRWCALLLLLGGLLPAEPKPDRLAVELTGRATDFWYSRNWASYYWREDFTFLLTDEASGKTWRVISREPTPAYHYRMGTTFPELRVDWKAKPRVKVVGVTGVDRIPADFYDFKLNEPNLATALVVHVETAPNTWKEYYVNNWVHPWGEKADRAIHARYADRQAPYDVYGFARGQVAPFDKAGQAILEKHKANPSLMFHGRVRTAKDTPFGYHLELIDLVGRDVKTGGHVLLHGDGKTIPLLDGRKEK